MSVLMTIMDKVMTTGMIKNASKITPTYHMFYYLKHGRPKGAGLLASPQKKVYCLKEICNEVIYRERCPYFASNVVG